jgi:hypothetical protein
MVKICQTGLQKLNFEIKPKKTHFPVFAKNFRRPWMKLKIFFCQFPNPWTLRVSGMGGYTSNCEKKSKSLHPSGEVLSQFLATEKSVVFISYFSKMVRA